MPDRSRGAEVDATQWERCLNYYFTQFNAWEYMFYQSKDGSIPVQLWLGGDAWMKLLVETKLGYGRFWSEYQVAFAEPFRSYAAAEFAKRPPPFRKITNSNARAIQRVALRVGGSSLNCPSCVE